MSALFTFRVKFTTARPVIPDQHTAFLRLAGEDSRAGLADARHLAITWVHLKYGASMVTRIDLLGAEI